MQVVRSYDKIKLLFTANPAGGSMITDYKSEIHKKRTTFEMRPHYLRHGSDGSYYCRTMHAVVPFEISLCHSCPLHFADPDGSECCRYFVPKGADEDGWTPDEQMEVIYGLFDKAVNH